MRSRNIKHMGKCSLFVCHCHMHPRFTWMPWFHIFKLLVCQPGSLSPCIHQTWYWRGKDHSPLRVEFACKINIDLGEPTKFTQHALVKYICAIYEACTSKTLSCIKWYTHMDTQTTDGDCYRQNVAMQISKKTTNCSFYLPWYCNIWPSNKYSLKYHKYATIAN